MITKLSFKIPDELHARFKAACARKKVYMRDVMEELIRDYVDQVEAGQ